MLPRVDGFDFRRWQLSDAALAATLWSDPKVMQYLGGPYTPEEVAARLKTEVSNDAAHGIQYWPLFVAGTDEFAGCCGLKPYDVANREYEIGFHFRPQFWGRGYASSAARAVIEHAFGPLDAAALYAGHHPENDASRTLLERLGFTQIGTHFFARTGLQHPWYRRGR